MRHVALLLAVALVATPALAQGAAPSGGPSQDAPSPTLPGKAPEPFKPEDAPATPDTWIFNGVLSASHEAYSGTLVASKDESEFELKLGNGATCDGDELKGEVGLVRLPEITCTDDRTLRALFVPQGGDSLKVFGHIGEERFSADAHLLGTETPPEPPQTAQPRGPLGLPPPGIDRAPGQPPK